MNLKNLSDEALLIQTKKVAFEERKMTLQVLHHLKEVSFRRLFARIGYSSLHQYTIHELGYCGSSASHRVDAMRLLSDIPEIEKKIEEGDLSLTTIAKAQTFFKKEDFSPEKKAEIVKSLEGKSVREVEKELLKNTDQPNLHLKERIKPVTPDRTEIKFYATDETCQELEKLRALFPGKTISEVISHAIQLGLKASDPAQKKVREPKKALAAEQPRVKESVAAEQLSKGSVTAEQVSTQSVAAQQGNTQKSQPAKHSRYIPRPIRKAVWVRDKGMCTFTSETGRKCGSRYRAQCDHIIPWALGGPTTVENLRLLCFHHNQYERERIFGRWTKFKGD
jgi:5-methylcytosine-specific restriction endonuclease McrA